MNINEISYEKVFPLGAFINEKIRVNVSVGVGEDAKAALDVARSLVHDYHYENNKDIYAMRGTVERTIEPVIQTNEQSKSNQVLSIIASINTCTETKVLESYRLIAKTNKDIQDAYDKKFISLSLPL